MDEVTLLDGGMGQELLRRSGDTPTHMWSTRLMIDNPDLVRAIHADFFAAGAQIATANTYALQRDRLVGTEFEDRFEALYDAALQAAETARADHGRGRIAGALGPLNGSYRPDAHPDLAQARPLYAEGAALMAGRVDLVICETVASLTHARAALQGARAAGVPVWLAVTVDDDDGTRLRSGESVADVVPIAVGEGASAVLANCSVPESMPAALRALAAAQMPMGVYANAFTRISPEFRRARSSVDSLQARQDLGPEAYADHAMAWVTQGARIIGGCCETGPDHIAAIKHRLATREVAALP